MPFTRAQATALLNKTEMRLFDDSRANALRGLDRAALAGRVERSRAARDRARDLLKRQRLAARKGGPAGRDGVAARTARKEELLVEILARFSEARRQAPVVKKAAKSPAKTAVKKAAKSPAKTAAKKVAKVPARAAASKAATSPAKAAAKTPAPRKRSARLTPEQALENTRQLLEAKQERDRAAAPWQALDHAAGPAPQAGYQSPQAAAKAQELHAGESRMAPIHGSVSTHDRLNQGKRDHRGSND